MRLPDLEAWAIFACVVEHRSFSGAADAIGVSKATVSKAITRLETHLGQSLFHRTSRRLSLTENGKALAEHAARILAEATAAEEAALDAATAPTGLVRVAAPMSLGLIAIAPVIADFLVAHPGIEIDLHLSDARVDIVAEGFDIALRIAALPDSSLRARKLADMRMYLVAAPEYLAQAGTPTHPGQLGEHRCFAYTNVTTPWRFVGPDGTEVSVRLRGPLATNSGEAMLPALRRGLGIAMLPDFIVGDDVAAGRLVPILSEWIPHGGALHLMTSPGTLRPARVEVLIAYLSEHLKSLCALQR
ncbi:LysR family transcriptional regulator [Sphingomonas psychrolutea]|uniref:Transcriptional regulator n=1 Tax=Sphingomonas psychrolutea TaxID=1259676 RepID=A0ABQ1H2M4_9SPHN|nr:LysR family transcriptional regulator [Sphingomonas psychrolutea]GGA54801.1 transcriptional regulator [Sphingomonas psychrolutea]